jgi:long-chain fatty acid transport protein
MATSKFIRTAIIVAATGAVAAPAFAGGLERGGYNIDLLFDDSDYAVDTSATFVAPQRKAKNVTGNVPTGSVGASGFSPTGQSALARSNEADDTENFWSKRVGVRARLVDNVDCMFDYSEPWGAHLAPGSNWNGASYNAETDVWSRNYATTCRVKFDAGKGDFSVIGGGFYQELGGFKDRLVGIATNLGNRDIIGNLAMKGNGWGWRAGVAYEIPEIALRTSLVYNSAVDIDLKGTVGTNLNTTRTDIYGNISMPDSLELKVQSGIAQDWLAFGSVKWTDWSQLQAIPFCSLSVTNCIARSAATSQANGVLGQLNLFYRDGWTISGGVGHKINDQWSVGGSVTWDRGVSKGMGALTDTWTFGTAVTYKPVENIEVRLAGAVGMLTSGSSVGTLPCPSGTGNCGEGAAYDFGTDFVAGVTTGIKIRF